MYGFKITQHFHTTHLTTKTNKVWKNPNLTQTISELNQECPGATDMHTIYIDIEVMHTDISSERQQCERDKPRGRYVNRQTKRNTVETESFFYTYRQHIHTDRHILQRARYY